MNKLDILEKKLKALNSFALGFSGGVDSMFLAALAGKISGIKVVAVTIVSAFMSKTDMDHAQRMAGQLGLDHRMIYADLCEIPDIRKNSKERCYFCKKKMFSLIKENLHGVDTVLHGANTDDLKDFRPGLIAAREMGIIAPLVDAGLSKAEIRMYSQDMGLETWDMPSQSCLATRIPYGMTITCEKLARIEESEAFLSGLGFKNFRVRCYGDMARLELDADGFEKIWENQNREKILAALKQIGFLHVALDLEGYVSGKMNRH
ncbi:MAG: ATP-dependent sacrificial sulfur transferase LarE [Desulfobacteraceae bacterium]